LWVALMSAEFTSSQCKHADTTSGILVLGSPADGHNRRSVVPK
jgi:hypothetical protein